MRRVRESVAETKVCQWYDGLGLLRIKLNLQGRRGWPDQEFFIPGGKPLLVEFKAEGEEPRKLQAYIHEQLRKSGYEVEVHTRAEDAIASIKAHLQRAGWRGGKQGNSLDAGAVPNRGGQVPDRQPVRRAVPRSRVAKD